MKKKSGVSLGIGGDEGTGKSGVILKLRSIIGESHFVEIHDPNDAVGEFNAPIMVKATYLFLFLTFPE